MLGQPEDLKEAINLASILQSVEEYNFFTFEILSGVLSLREIRQFPIVDKQKGLDLIRHQQLKLHFRNAPNLIIEQRIQEVADAHRSNIMTSSKIIEDEIKVFTTIAMKTGISMLYSEA